MASTPGHDRPPRPSVGLGALLPLAVILGGVALVLAAAIRQAGELGSRTRCAENLRRIHAAATDYARDHDGRWPDVFEDASDAWFHVGNTRTDGINPGERSGSGEPDQRVAGAEPGPAGPGDNGGPVRSNTANLWALVHYGLEPACFVCPATDHRPDAVDLEPLRRTWAEYLAAKREAEAALARWEAAKATAAEEAAAKAAREGAPEELTLDDLFGPSRKPAPEKGPPSEEAPAEAPRPGDAQPDEEAPDETPLPPGPGEIDFPERPAVPRDFRGETFCSYSCQNVLGEYSLEGRAEAAERIAVAADASPLRRDVWSGPDEPPAGAKTKAKANGATKEGRREAGEEDAVGSRVERGPTDAKLAERPVFPESDETAPWNEQVDAVTRPWELNSPNHGFEGQNVLYLDGHVEWTVHPYCGPNGDNIWLRRRTDVPRSPVPDDLASLRQFNDPESYDGASTLDADSTDDSFLVP